GGGCAKVSGGDREGCVGGDEERPPGGARRLWRIQEVREGRPAEDELEVAVTGAHGAMLADDIDWLAFHRGGGGFLDGRRRRRRLWRRPGRGRRFGRRSGVRPGPCDRDRRLRPRQRGGRPWRRSDRGPQRDKSR